MAITISPMSSLFNAPMAAQPLETALQNLNELWNDYSPPLVDFCPIPGAVPAATACVWTIPVDPSADSIYYSMRVLIVSGGPGTAVVTWNFGATTLTDNVVLAAGLNVSTLRTYVDPSVDLMNFTIVSSVNVTMSHVLVYPDEDSGPPSGDFASGFIPWRDTLNGSTLSINTEQLNRCKASVMALVADRRQMVLSFSQRSPYDIRTNIDASSGVMDDYQLLPTVRVFVPFAFPTVTLEVHAIATTTGSGVDLVRVQQISDDPAAGELLLAASGSHETGILICTVDNPNQLLASVDLQIGVKNGYSGGQQETILAALCAYWKRTT